MGFRFRKSIKIAPGVRVNLTKKGVSSVSVGKRGARVNVSKKGTRSTVGLPGSGLSYSSYQSHAQSKPLSQQTRLPTDSIASNPLASQPSNNNNVTQKSVSILLGIGIFICPLIFAWFTLRQGYSTLSRVISMVWMVLFLFAIR